MKLHCSLSVSILGLCLAGLTSLQADSPLTSTTFYKAYLTKPAVKKAAQTHFLSQDLLAVLQDESTPIQEKMALVNGLGWSFDQDLGNSAVYLNQLCQDKEIHAEAYRAHFDTFSSEELTLLGYMMALENYLNDPALESIVEILDAAVAKDSTSYSANLALTLVRAQLLMADMKQWKRVWQEYEKLKRTPGLRNKLNAEATKIIEDYLKLYEAG